jgi:hypothetical protein
MPYRHLWKVLKVFFIPIESLGYDRCSLVLGLTWGNSNKLGNKATVLGIFNQFRLRWGRTGSWNAHELVPANLSIFTCKLSVIKVCSLGCTYIINLALTDNFTGNELFLHHHTDSITFSADPAWHVNQYGGFILQHVNWASCRGLNLTQSGGQLEVASWPKANFMQICVNQKKNPYGKSSYNYLL